MKTGMKMKKIYFLLLAVSLAACLSPWQGDEGNLIISLGGNARAVAWPPSNDNGVLPVLVHRITLQGPTGTITRTLPPGVTVGRFNITPGLWTVTIEAWYDGYLFGISNTANVEVRAGQQTQIGIEMEKTDTTFFVVSSSTEWDTARTAIVAGGNNKSYVINITNGFSVPGSTANTFGSVTGINVTIRGNQTVSLSSNGNLLRIAGGQTVVMQNLDLIGLSTNNTSLIWVQGSGAIFTMQGNASISGNFSVDGGGVYVSGGTFTMRDNSMVFGNTTSILGGGVYVNSNGGNFIMQDNASVSGNSTISSTLSGNGGGVFIDTSGNFTMRDRASVSGNTARNSIGDSTFSGNGGGVYVVNGSFTMLGSASVYENEATNRGGGVYMLNGTFRIAGGTVYGNTALPTTLRNTVGVGGAALYVLTGGAATYGGPDGMANSFGTAPFGIDYTITQAGVQP